MKRQNRLSSKQLKVNWDETSLSRILSMTERLIGYVFLSEFGYSNHFVNTPRSVVDWEGRLNQFLISSRKDVFDWHCSFHLKVCRNQGRLVVYLVQSVWFYTECDLHEFDYRIGIIRNPEGIRWCHSRRGVIRQIVG